MALQFLDDLGQPFGLGAPGDQQRLQRLGVVRQRLGQHRHGGD